MVIVQINPIQNSCKISNKPYMYTHTGSLLHISHACPYNVEIDNSSSK